MKRLLSVIGGLSLLLACSNDEFIPVNSSVRDAFYARYPTAQDVSWALVNNYYVADFDLPEDGVLVDCSAWFSPEGLWYLTERDMLYSALPAAVTAAFEAGDYATWRVEDIELIERPSAEVEYEINAEGFVEGVETEVFLYYLEDGSLVRTVLDPESGYGWWDYLD